jgi:hypothetical protein
MIFAFLHKSGVYNIVRGYGRRVGTQDNAMIRIYYLEQVAGDWSNLNTLTPEQQTHLSAFIEDSKKDVEILKGGVPCTSLSPSFVKDSGFKPSSRRQ